MRALRLTALLLFVTSGVAASAQTVFVDEALDRSMKQSSLVQAQDPFHAVMEITGPTPAYSAHLDLISAAPNQYRLTIQAPGFTQLRVVTPAQSFTQTTGDFLPRWLETLTDGLLDPTSLATPFRRRATPLPTESDRSALCVRQDDRPNNITDQLTWGILCFSSPDLLITSVLTFNNNLILTDFRSFAYQHIARTFSTDVLDFKPVTGHLTVLEKIAQPDSATFAIPVGASNPIHTTFVSTLKEESLVDTSPTITWPTVREGRTEGYMIVYARTDRTGQVRETAKHNSDNPGLEQFGMEQALRYKFKPLVIDGIPQQMEMPLVLHFHTALADALPVLNDAQTRAQISGCRLPTVKPGHPSSSMRISVNEAGKLTGVSNMPRGQAGLALYNNFRSCTFAPLKVNGVPTYYHGDLIFPQ